ncbi:MAG: hypothetical protein ACRDK3_10140 [Actinomycetota bacterium]
MILAHHGLGEELVLSAVAAGGGAASVALLLCRVRIAMLVKWLRRR